MENNLDFENWKLTRDGKLSKLFETGNTATTKQHPTIGPASCSNIHTCTYISVIKVTGRSSAIAVLIGDTDKIQYY